MARTSSNFFALGTNGIAVYGAGLFRMLAFEQPKMACTVTALVEAPNHDIWINGSRGIIRIPTGEMQHALSPARHKIYAEEVHEGDFVGPATYWKPTPSANVDTEGTLWFSTLNGVVHIDPEILNSPTRLSQLAIRSIAANEHPIGLNEFLPAF